jgi:tetratricopeptide (TPR) repeat protein
LTGSEKALGRESSSYLATAWALAGVLKKQKKWDLAEEMMKRTIAGQEKTFGLDHNSTLISLMGLAELLNGRGKYGEALLLYERALPSAESRWGKESLTVARHSEKYSDLVERLKANPETQSSL